MNMSLYDIYDNDGRLCYTHYMADDMADCLNRYGFRVRLHGDKDGLQGKLKVVVRDINGEWFFDYFSIGEVSFAEDEEDLEIMMVFTENQCIYNALRDDPITWDDLRGFWA